MGVYANKSDHEHVREAVRRGEIIPLRVILQRLDKEIHGKVIEIELDDDDDEWIYEIKVLRKNTVVKFEIDATTGRILKVKERDKR